MKNIVILSLLLAFSVPFSPVKAQVSEPATSAQVEEMKNALITLLTQLIAQLQDQITILLAQQATQATQLGAVQTKVDAVVSQTAPIPVITPPVPTLSIGTPYCRDGEGYLPITIEGKNWGSALFYLQPQTDTGKIFYGNPDAQTGGRSWMGTHPENTSLDLGYHPDDAGPAIVVVLLNGERRLTVQASLTSCN